MKCCHGDHEFSAPSYATHNAQAYGKPVVVVSWCCNQPVRMEPVTRIHLTSYEGNASQDDWGALIKRSA